jgi:hypothetical protein
MTLHFQKKKESIGKLKTSQRDQKQEKKRKSPSRLKGDNSKIQKQKQEEEQRKEEKEKKSKREHLKSENYDFQALVKALQSLFIFEFKVIFMCLFFMQQTFMEIQI